GGGAARQPRRNCYAGATHREGEEFLAVATDEGFQRVEAVGVQVGVRLKPVVERQRELLGSPRPSVALSWREREVREEPETRGGCQIVWLDPHLLPALWVLVQQKEHPPTELPGVNAVLGWVETFLALAPKSLEDEVLREFSIGVGAREVLSESVTRGVRDPVAASLIGRNGE